MSVWRRGPLGKSPYARTAFRIARVPREIVRHRTVVQIIGQTMQVVSSSASVHVVLGQPVTTEELNWAQRVLLDPRSRLEEELVEHAAERPPTEALRKLDRRATALMMTMVGDPPGEGSAAPSGPAPRPLAFLRPAARGLAVRFLAAAPAVDPSLGALELGLGAPFGADDEGLKRG